MTTQPSLFSRSFRTAVVCGVALVGSAGNRIHADTEVRSEPGGVRLMAIEGSEVRVTPGGARLLYIDENTIRTGPGAPHVLYIDGDDVRTDPGGPRVARFDGNLLRRAPGGPVLLVVDGQEIRKEPGGPPVLRLEGDALSRPQLAAALYQWNPALFRLSPDELARLQQEAETAAASAAQATRELLFGKFKILNSNIAFLAKGTVEITKPGDYYLIRMDFGDGRKWSGVAAERTCFRQLELWTALGPTDGTLLGIYEAADRRLAATWIPQAALSRGKGVLGSETLEGPAVFNGNYSISGGKHVLERGSYSGTLRMATFPTPENKSFQPRYLEYQLGNAKVVGIGAIIPFGLERQALVAAVSTDKIFAVGRIGKDDRSGVRVDFCTNTKVSGTISLAR